jgi:hypothetical protein
MNEKPTRRSGGSRLKEGVVEEKQVFRKLAKRPAQWLAIFADIAPYNRELRLARHGAWE